MDLPISFCTRRASSCWESSRSKPRSVPSTSRRYRSFSPSFISQSVIIVLQIAIAVKRKFGSLPAFCGALAGKSGTNPFPKPGPNEQDPVVRLTKRTQILRGVAKHRPCPCRGREFGGRLLRGNGGIRHVVVLPPSELP